MKERLFWRGLLHTVTSWLILSLCMFFISVLVAQFMVGAVDAVADKVFIVILCFVLPVFGICMIYWNAKFGVYLYKEFSSPSKLEEHEDMILDEDIRVQ